MYKVLGKSANWVCSHRVVCVWFNLRALEHAYAIATYAHAVHILYLVPGWILALVVEYAQLEMATVKKLKVGEIRSISKSVCKYNYNADFGSCEGIKTYLVLSWEEEAVWSTRRRVVRHFQPAGITSCWRLLRTVQDHKRKDKIICWLSSKLAWSHSSRGAALATSNAQDACNFANLISCSRVVCVNYAYALIESLEETSDRLDAKTQAVTSLTLERLPLWDGQEQPHLAYNSNYHAPKVHSHDIALRTHQ